MPILIKAGETTAARKRVYFHCVDATDGLSAETGEADGQPQISTNGAAFTNTGIGTLVAIGNGRYYAELTDAALDTTGRVIESRYKSDNTAETIGTTVQVVAFDPHAIAGLGLTNLDAPISGRAAPGDEMDLVDAPNATAVTAIQDGLSKTSDPINFIVTGDTIVDGDLRIEAPRGDTYTYAWTCLDADSVAVDLSGYDDYLLTVKPVANRSDTDDANAVFQVAGVLSGDDNNVLTFSLSVANTEACDLNTWYDADIEASTTGRTSVSTLATGLYRTTLDVTRTTPE